MFDGIHLKDRIVCSMFDPSRSRISGAASGVRESMQLMEVCDTVCALKLSCIMKRGWALEIASNFRIKKCALNVRRNGSQPSICVPTFSQFTNKLKWVIVK